MNLIEKLKAIQKDDKRSSTIYKNIIASFAIKGWSVLVQLMLVPLTLACLGVYENGVWLTISSVLLWIDNLDVGLGNGLRNKLAIYIAENNIPKAREMVSSTMAMLTVIIVPIAFFLVVLELLGDVYGLFEWNEAAENTYFQPSVNNGRCLERILNFYLQKLRGEPYSGRPGDCAEIPQLIFTARKKVCLGEVIHLEMLNLPDRNVPEEYPARLMLKNESGKTVAEFPVETFRRNEMKAVTYRRNSLRTAGF